MTQKRSPAVRTERTKRIGSSPRLTISKPCPFRPQASTDNVHLAAAAPFAAHPPDQGASGADGVRSGYAERFARSSNAGSRSPREGPYVALYRHSTHRGGLACRGGDLRSGTTRTARRHPGRRRLLRVEEGRRQSTGRAPGRVALLGEARGMAVSVSHGLVSASARLGACASARSLPATGAAASSFRHPRRELGNTCTTLRRCAFAGASAFRRPLSFVSAASGRAVTARPELLTVRRTSVAITSTSRPCQLRALGRGRSSSRQRLICGPREVADRELLRSALCAALEEDAA